MRVAALASSRRCLPHSMAFKYLHRTVHWWTVAFLSREQCARRMWCMHVNNGYEQCKRDTYQHCNAEVFSSLDRRISNRRIRSYRASVADRHAPNITPMCRRCMRFMHCFIRRCCWSVIPPHATAWRHTENVRPCRAPDLAAWWLLMNPASFLSRSRSSMATHSAHALYARRRSWDRQCPSAAAFCERRSSTRLPHDANAAATF